MAVIRRQTKLKIIRLMKKIIYLLGALLGFMVVSCSKEGRDLANHEQSNVAKFSTAAITRVVNDTWQDGDEIGIFMIQNQSMVSEYTNVKYSKNGLDGASTSFKAAGNEIFLPTTDVAAGFFAYYPYSSTIQGSTISVDLTNQSNPADINLLIASVVDNGGEVYNNRKNDITLQFKHALSKLTINPIAGEGFLPSDFQNMIVTIKGHTTSANYNITSEELVPSQKIGLITAYTAVNGSKYEFLLLPSVAVSGSSVIFTINNNDYVWDISSIALDKGVNHSFDVTISKSGVKLNSAEITPWNPDENSNDNSFQGVLTVSDIKLVNGVYEIYTAKGLVALADLVNGNVNSSNATSAGVNLGFGSPKKKITAKLMRDIYLGSECGPTIKNWTPIGNSKENNFSGSTFDGNNKIIYDLYINNTSDFQGLFGRTVLSEIKNLTIKDAVVKGNLVVGAIVGEINEKSISHCHVVNSSIEGNARVGALAGVLTGSNVLDSTTDNKTEVKGSNNFIGGIAGEIYSYDYQIRGISDCNNYASVSTAGNEIGGIVGNITGVVGIVRCNNYGKINGAYRVGGIVGSADTDLSSPTADLRVITECANHGVINGKERIGGIAGSLSNSTIYKCNNQKDVTTTGSSIAPSAGGIIGSMNKYGMVRECWNSGNVTARSRAGGIAGLLRQATIMACYNRGTIKATANYAGGIAAEMESTVTGFTDEIEASIIASYNLGSVTSDGGHSEVVRPSVGGIVGYTWDKKVSIISCYHKGTISGIVSTGPIIGYYNQDQKFTSKNNFYVGGNEYGPAGLGGIKRLGSVRELNENVGNLNKDHDTYDYVAGVNDNTPPHLILKP